MKPTSRKVFPSSGYLDWIAGDFGTQHTVANIKGEVRKLGENYINSMVVLFDRSTLKPIATSAVDKNSKYRFLGLNPSRVFFVVAFDNKKKFNAVIQDNVVPK